ncbi:MAG: BLUF domain-containing protein [Gammaproteobacteria bacterium]
MLVELIYASEVEDSVSIEEVRTILATSQRNNAAVQVTGALIFNSRFFLQWLEGDRHVVNRTYHRIAADSRHRGPELLSYRESPQREFSRWSMGYMGEGMINQELLLKYSANGEFNPYAMSADAARGLMLDLSRVSVSLTA